MAVTPSPSPTVRVQHKPSIPVGVELSVFDILNIFRRRWFLSRANLLANAISAQKAEDGKISWVEFTPPFHSHLVKCAVALVPHPVNKVKKAMFVFMLELLNGEGSDAFFNLVKGGRKVNNAQREKRRLARKRSRAAKREREREVAKAAALPPRQRECLSCGRKFASRKTSLKHKCPNSKVVRMGKAAASRPGSQPTPLALPDQPVAQLTFRPHRAVEAPTLVDGFMDGWATHAPPDPTHNDVTPAVTGHLQEPVSPLPPPRKRKRFSERMADALGRGSEEMAMSVPRWLNPTR
jgi:hypothetical protein